VNRRDFVRACGAAGTGAAVSVSLHALAQGDTRPKPYHRALLVDEAGAPVRASRLPTDRAFVFLYPYASTPCFLIDLGRPLKAPADLRTADARGYRWQGGVGPRSSIVAYSAICAHQLTYPTREISFIGYRDKPTPHSRAAQVIHCCSEHSQYDAAAGGRVLGGPAPQPLAAIVLEHDPQPDTLTATGTLGGEMFDAFFAKFEFRLALEHGGNARAAAAERTTLRDLANYCRQQVRC